jgi:hypothetical protein
MYCRTRRRGGTSKEKEPARNGRIASMLTWIANAIGLLPTCFSPALMSLNIDIDRPAARRKLANATGDQIFTDGKISVLQPSSVKVPIADKPASASNEPLH